MSERVGIDDTLLAYGRVEADNALKAKDREQYQFWQGWNAALDRVSAASPASAVVPLDKNDNYSDQLALPSEQVHTKNNRIPQATDISALAVVLEDLRAENKRLREAIEWALGERDDFTEEPPPLKGKWRRRFWWRTELRQRAFGESALAARAPHPEGGQ